MSMRKLRIGASDRQLAKARRGQLRRGIFNWEDSSLETYNALEFPEHFSRDYAFFVLCFHTGAESAIVRL
jgi:hypothetical protein